MEIPKILESLKEDLKVVEDRMLGSFRSTLPFVNDISLRAALAGGKRIRPAILILSSQAVTGSVGALDLENIYWLAASVEMIHLASLVHDDVVDHSEVRRGDRTINSLWGNSISVLLGDSLYARASSLVNQYGNKDILDIIASTTSTMCEGEIKEIRNRFNLSLQEEDYLDVLRMKTAVFTAACCEVGAKFRVADAGEVKALHDYGEAFGMVFQIVDDMFDLFSSIETVGKPVGLDTHDGFLTLPLIHTLKTCSQGERDQINKILRSQPNGHDPKATLKNLVTRYGGRDYAHEKAKYYVAHAEMCLESLKPSPAKDKLKELALFALERKY